MLYNLRSDIIYYKSNSDFELEFNLCGCCRMRLLTDKPSTKKAFVHSLARAVSRSRVIIIAGPIFGPDNTIEIVSQALSATTEVVDNAAYGISSDEEIQIIKGALPLVSNDGSFGGCIIESGPQTMILLTDNKALRKNLMSSLIHPYIAELYSAELNGNKKADEEEEKNDAADTEATEEAAVEAETATEVETEEETEIFLPDGNEEDTAEETDENTQGDTETDEDAYDVPLVLSFDDQETHDDITEEDIFIDTPETIEQEYEPDKDISIDDLFPSTPGLEEPVRTIEEKIDGAEIIMESEEHVKGDLPEAYHNAFNNLFKDDDTDNEDANYGPENISDYNLFGDEANEENEPEEEFVKIPKPKLQIATIIFTVILLLAIAVLCYTIFSAAKTEGTGAMEYIKEVWQTVFG